MKDVYHYQTVATSRAMIKITSKPESLLLFSVPVGCAGFLDGLALRSNHDAADSTSPRLASSARTQSLSSKPSSRKRFRDGPGDKQEKYRGSLVNSKGRFLLTYLRFQWSKKSTPTSSKSSTHHLNIQ